MILYPVRNYYIVINLFTRAVKLLQVVNHRSKNIILVKNLPAGTQVSEIRELFSKYGVLGKVLLPPSGITSMYCHLKVITVIKRSFIPKLM